MSTRVSSLANSSRAKQRLVQLLFSSKYSRQGKDAHKKLVDYHSYSYMELKAAYLNQLQVLHPDKVVGKHQSAQTQSKQKSLQQLQHQDKYPQQNTQQQQQKNAFHELREAWDSYNEYTKMLRKVGKSYPNSMHEGTSRCGIQENFTMFGVGCSFADTELERHRRAEIMDQACRGWFSAGLLEEECNDRVNSVVKEEKSIQKNEVSLLDEDLFNNTSMSFSTQEKYSSSNSTSLLKTHASIGENVESTYAQSVTKPTFKRSLIDHMLPKGRAQQK